MFGSVKIFEHFNEKLLVQLGIMMLIPRYRIGVTLFFFPLGSIHDVTTLCENF